MSSVIGEAEKLSPSTSAQPCHQFTLAQIQSATRDFSDEQVIGKGGFGKVYKGCISIEETGHVVAIKRLDSMSDQGAAEFRTEIEMLSRLRHSHLVSLIGFCEDDKEMILVYEYMPHGTLYLHLHKADTRLNWVQRLKIAIGAGRGLDYLHTGIGTQHGVIHRDVKSSNILLDEDWAARISDFGLSKVGPTNQSVSYVEASVKGTFGYLDPEYFYTQRLTRKTDVFAFGVVLFELLSGRLPVDMRFGEEQCSLVRWGQTCMKDRKLDQMVDSSIRGTIFPKYLKRFAQIADRCLHSFPKERPTMTEVVASLQVLLKLQEKISKSAESSGIMGLSWKTHNISVSTSKENSDHGAGRLQNEELVAGDLKMFTYIELQCATRNFHEKRCLFDGYDVAVYRGWVDKTTYFPSIADTGLPVTIKIYPRYKCLDLEMLKLFNHPNLIKLLGYSSQCDQLFLMFEFMPNGSFHNCLLNGTLSQLPLVTKVKIAVGIARGIVIYLKTQDEISVDPDQRRTLSEYRLDRQKILQDEGLTTGNLFTRLKDDIGENCYDPWSKPFQLRSNISGTYPWTRAAVKGSWLDRRKILLDEDFTPKLSDYEASMLADNECPQENWEINHYDLVHGDYYPGFKPAVQQQRNLPSFTVVLAEVLTGKEISNLRDFHMINDFLCQGGQKSLALAAKLCFETCTEVDSESKMLTIIKEYEQYLQPQLLSAFYRNKPS